MRVDGLEGDGDDGDEGETGRHDVSCPGLSDPVSPPFQHSRDIEPDRHKYLPGSTHSDHCVSQGAHTSDISLYILHFENNSESSLENLCQATIT